MELSLEGMRLFYEFRSRFDELSESALRWLIGRGTVNYIKYHLTAAAIVRSANGELSIYDEYL